MTLREAEKEVLRAALVFVLEKRGSFKLLAQGVLEGSVHRYRHMKAAGKPRVTCYCGKPVSIEGDHLRYHMQPDGTGHAPMLTDSRLPTAQPRGGGNEEGIR